MSPGKLGMEDLWRSGVTTVSQRVIDPDFLATQQLQDGAVAGCMSARHQDAYFRFLKGRLVGHGDAGGMLFLDHEARAWRRRHPTTGRAISDRQRLDRSPWFASTISAPSGKRRRKCIGQRTRYERADAGPCPARHAQRKDRPPAMRAGRRRNHAAS